MSIHQYTYVFYGILVAKNDPKEGEGPRSYEVWARLLESIGYDTDFVAENVRYFMCGAYDRNDMYLKIDQDGYPSIELKPGQRRAFHSSQPVNETWDTHLISAAMDLGLEIHDGPAWFAVSDEG